MLSKAMNDFITVALHIDGFAPYPSDMKNMWRSDSPGKAEIEAGLRGLLVTRELTTLDWARMTAVEFPSEDELYVYLQALYDYLFQNGKELPEIPDDA